MKKFILVPLMFSVIFFLFAATLWENEVPIRLGANIIWNSSGAKTADGGVIYVWSDTRRGDRDIWAQKVDAQGNIIWNEPILIDGKLNHQDEPVIIQTSDNNFVIAWIDYFNEQAGDIYAQKISSQGQLLWQSGGIPVCNETDWQTNLNIVADNNGGVYLVWGDYRCSYWKMFGQHLTSQGNILWDPNGIELITSSTYSVLCKTLSDGQGGLIIAYSLCSENNQNVYIKRFLSDGTMIWQQPIVLYNSLGSHYCFDGVALANNEFMFSWIHSSNGNFEIYAHKMDINGNILWQNPTIIYTTVQSLIFGTFNDQTIIPTSDNGAIIAWVDDGLISGFKDLFAQKVSAEGNCLWGNNAIRIAQCVGDEISLAPDSNGGCYISWTDTNNYDIFGQHQSSTGLPLWESDGKEICNAPNYQYNPLVIVNDNFAYFAWDDIRDGSDGIYYQVFNPEGISQLTENGQLIFWGIGGEIYGENCKILPRSQDVLIVWTDFRDPHLGSKIFFQFLNPDGSVDLEPDGRPLILPIYGPQAAFDAIVLPDDSIVFAWMDERNGNYKIYLQHIDSNGIRLWGDYGIPLTECNPYMQKDPQLSYLAEQNQIYIGWSSKEYYDDTISHYHVYGQMIQNGEKQWGPNGLLISSFDNADMANNQCILKYLKENYYIWENYNYIACNCKVIVKKVSATGETAPGWQDSGIPVSNENDNYFFEESPLSTLTTDGIFVMWRNSSYYGQCYGQHISSTGEMLWDPSGIMLLNNDFSDNYFSLVENTFYRDDIVFTWKKDTNNPAIFTQKYSLSGLPLWNNSGIFVNQNYGNTDVEPLIARFDNGGFIIVWVDLSFPNYSNLDLYYNYVNSNGTVVSDNPYGYVLFDGPANQICTSITTVGSEAYVIWVDDSDYSIEGYTSLYAQKISNETPINDSIMPSIVNFQLIQNYPNPFNPSTNIKFIINETTNSYTLNIYNLKGQLVKTLVKGNLEKGTHNIVWDGTDSNGNNVSSGIYLYSLSNGKSNQIKRMVLMK